MATDPLLIKENSPSLSDMYRFVADHFQEHKGVRDMVFYAHVHGIMEALNSRYEEQPRGESRERAGVAGKNHPYFYPYLGIYVPFSQGKEGGVLGEEDHGFGRERDRASYGIFSQGGFYGCTLTQPKTYEAYWREQLSVILSYPGVLVGVGTSASAIPISFLPPLGSRESHRDGQMFLGQENPTTPLPPLGSRESHRDGQMSLGQENPMAPLPPLGSRESHRDGQMSLGQERKSFPSEGKGKSPLPCLHAIERDDHEQWGEWEALSTKPLGLFSAQRVDYSLARLQHYCGTSGDHFQNFVLLTNYPHYVDSFLSYARDPARRHQGYTSWVGPMGRGFSLDEEGPSTPWESYKEEGRNFQMPAYHLQKPGGQGITLINVGVGPSNMKTITDHLAVLRSHCWLMLGHCGGLDHGQGLGDFVTATAYLREDRVLDEELPLAIPIPALWDVQEALYQAGSHFFPHPAKLHQSLRSGTVLTTANRNWELRIGAFSKLIHQSHALAIDMESATLAANAFRFSIPYGALLCISDRPLHGDLKMPESAQIFYKERVQQHMLLGIKAMEILSNTCPRRLHSRKLRGFYHTPLR